MKRLVLAVALALVVLLLGLELAVRGGGRTTELAPAAAFEPDRRGWCGGAWLETDAAGMRRAASDPAPAPAPRASAPARRIVAIGGAFTAGAGLEAEELYVARLQAHARAGGFGDALAIATRGSKVEEAHRRLGPAGGAVAQDVAQSLFVLEIDGGELGADPDCFGIAAPARHALAPVERSASAALTWMRLIALRRERSACDAAIAELVARDGFTGRAAAQEKMALAALTTAIAQRRLDPRQTRVLRAWIDELWGLAREEERREQLAQWRALFEELQRAHLLAIVVVSGPTLPTLGLVQAARDARFPVLHAPPFELDPELRVDAPFPRPAAVVHAQVADSLWAELTRRGLLLGAAAAPEPVMTAADAIEQQVLTRGGFDEATISLVRGQIAASIAFGPEKLASGELPANALHGLGANGLLEPGVAAEIVLLRPSAPADLIVRAEAATGAVPRLALRHRADQATAAPRVLRPVAGRADRELLEWRFAPPPAQSPIDYTCLEFGLLPSEAGAPPAPIELREVRFTESQEQR